MKNLGETSQIQHLVPKLSPCLAVILAGALMELHAGQIVSQFFVATWPSVK